MSFSNFENTFMKRNQQLMWMVVGSLALFSIVILLMVFQKSYFTYQGGDLFKERRLSEHVCKDSFTSIAKGSPNPHLVSSGILDVLDKQGFQIDLKEILKVDSLEKGACRIILDSGSGLLAFKVSLLENQNFPFYYKLNQIDELELDKEWL
jgi:hypothetical protein